MAGFSPRDASLEGFRLTRENPGVVLVWAVLWFGLYLALYVSLARAGVLGALRTFDMAHPPSPEAMLPVMQKAFGAISLIFPLWLAVFVLIQTSVMRMVLRPQEKGLAYMRVSVDEARVLLAQLAIFGLVLGLYIVAVLLVAATGAAPAIASLAVIVFMALMLVLLVRLSMAIPATFATGRVTVLASWSMTRGRFLPLLAAYALAFVFNVVVSILGGVIGEAVNGLAGGKAVSPSTVADLAQPAFLGITAIQAILQAMGTALTLAPCAWIYRQIARVDVIA
jgi:hypothetical protein